MNQLIEFLTRIMSISMQRQRIVSLYCLMLYNIAIFQSSKVEQIELKACDPQSPQSAQEDHNAQDASSSRHSEDSEGTQYTPSVDTIRESQSEQGDTNPKDDPRNQVIEKQSDIDNNLNNNQSDQLGPNNRDDQGDHCDKGEQGGQGLLDIKSSGITQVEDGFQKQTSGQHIPMY